MTGIRMGATIVGAVVLLAGCDIVDNALIPTLTGEDPAGKPAAEEQVAAPASTAGSTTQTTALSGPATGTTVGQRVQSLRTDVVAMQRSVNAENADYQRLRQSSNDQISQYRQLVGDTQTKLQLGTTAGNPELVGSLNDARGALDQLSDNVEQMTVLSKRVADDRSMGLFILQSIDATFALSGAVDADHAQLKVLEDETKRTQVLIGRLTTELNSDIPNQSNFVAREQASLAALNAAVAVGKLPDAGAAPASAPPAAAAASVPAPAPNLATRRPFVVIRFDRDDVAYEEPLFNAVQKALDRRPSAVFDLVSVVPSQGDAAVAERNAERVMRSLTDMGLPSERISLSALSSNKKTSNEVQVYVR